MELDDPPGVAAEAAAALARVAQDLGLVRWQRSVGEAVIDGLAPGQSEDRLKALGATEWYGRANFTTLRDPEGNPFCVIDAD